MKLPLLVVRKDLKELVRIRGLLPTFIGMAVLFLLMCAFSFKLPSELPAEPELILRAKLNFLLYLLAFSVILMEGYMICAYSVPLEKTKRTLEPLLASPIGARQVWMGKTLSSFLPSCAVGFLCSLLFLLIFEHTAVIPLAGRPLSPHPIVCISTFLLLPSALFFLFAFVVGLQLISTNYRIFFLIPLGIFLALIYGGGKLLERADLGSPDFLFFNLLFLALTSLLALAVSKYISPERIVLTSRQE